MKRFISGVATLATVLGLSAAPAAAIQVGDRIKADIEVHRGFPPEKVNLAEYIGDRKVVLLGLPGAFTPT